MGLRSFFKPIFDPSLTVKLKNKIENNFCNPFRKDQ